MQFYFTQTLTRPTVEPDAVVHGFLLTPRKHCQENTNILQQGVLQTLDSQPSESGQISWPLHTPMGGPHWQDPSCPSDLPGWLERHKKSYSDAVVELLLWDKAVVEGEALWAALLPPRLKHWLPPWAGWVGREGLGACPSLSAIAPPHAPLKAQGGDRPFLSFKTFLPSAACWAQHRRLKAALKAILGLT